MYVRDDKPFGGKSPPAAMFYHSRDRKGKHPQAHVAKYAGLFQADAFDGYGKLYLANRSPGPILEAACWVHARRPVFWLFCGSDRGGQRVAAMYSLIVTAKMNNIDPQAWSADVLVS